MQHEESLTHLLDNLNNQKNAYSELLVLARKEHEFVVGGDVDNLANVVKVIDAITGNLRDLEFERQTILAPIAKQMSVDAEELSLQKIGDHFPRLSEELKTLKKDILDLINDIRKMDSKNAKLIKKALDDIDYLLKILNGDGAFIYEKTGGKKDKHSILIDRKA